VQNHRTSLLLFTGLGSHLQRKEYIFLLVHDRILDGHVEFSIGINLTNFSWLRNSFLTENQGRQFTTPVFVSTLTSATK